MKIAITGASGFIGSHLASFFQAHHTVTKINRHKELGPQLEGHDVVIHLAAEGVAKKRWTASQKIKIIDSRVKGTRTLCEVLKTLKAPPGLLLSASAIGFYGSRSGEICHEKSAPGKGFLPSVAVEWERATEILDETAIRVIHMRVGLVLGPKGGALSRMLPIFTLGLGGKLGSGHQMMSWIALDEIPSIINFLIEHKEMSGAVNFVSPHAVSNQMFTKILGRVLRKPTLFPLPAFVAKLMFGEMAEELLLTGANVVPRKLLDAGYRYQHSDLEKILEKIV